MLNVSQISSFKKGAAMFTVAGMLSGAALVSSAYAESQIPVPPKPFKGEMNTTFMNSVPDWPERPTAPKGAPNVVIIMTDDVGFGAGSTWGGPVNTPTQTQLAREGLQYNQFHTTAVSSPTRAALLTGRNHHTAHTGSIMETALGYPGYDTLLGPDTATIGEMLRQSGYSTAWIGKNHNVPDFEMNAIAGPQDRWPTRLGFEKFYGFIGAESDQYSPYSLYDGTTSVSPYLNNPDYYLNRDLSTHASNWIKYQKSIAPDKPFFLYYVPGGTHAPHQVDKKWSDKYKGKFDKGWDALREETLANQKKLGIAPQNTKLTERPKEIPAWNTLSDKEKKLYARQMEVYAGYLEQTDYEIGRVLKTIEEIGQKDNTIVIYLQGDNGASGEGSITGSMNENYLFNAQVESIDDIDITKLGTPEAYNHYSIGWAHAMDAPFQWMKQVASHFGGTRNGLVISWPKGIKAKGEIRTQFHHVIDIVPTILEVAGIQQPNKVNSIEQKPIEGVSMAYTFKDAKAKSTHTSQYFEVYGYHAMYHDGWIAATKPTVMPWMQGKVDSDLPKVWELYNITEDYSEAVDLAKKYPEKLEELILMFNIEAGRYNVYPIWTSSTKFLPIDAENRPNPNEGRNKFTYFGTTDHISEGMAPNFKNTSYSIEADMEFPEGKAPAGVILTMGGQFGGFSFWINEGKPTFSYINPRAADFYEVASKTDIKPGKHKVKFEFVSDFAKTKKPGAGGVGTIYVDGKKVAEGRIEKTIPYRFSLSEYMDVGVDYGTSVSKSYKVPYAVNGTLNKVEVDIKK